MPAVDMEKRAVWLKTNRPKINQQRRGRYAKAPKEPRRAKRREYHKAHDKPYHSARTKRYRRKLKLAVIAGYGGKCSCCGETEPDFLTVEHKNGDGKAHRALGISVYADLRKRGYPKGYTVHCFNCNIAKSLFGTCPHKRKK